jgi:Uma2 family endonuclease
MATSQFVAPSRHRISADAFHRMGEAGILGPADRVELIAGEIIDMSPIGVMHAAIVDVLSRHFGRWARESLFVRCQNPLRLDDLSEPEPDLTILRPRADCYTMAHPAAADVLLVIEVADRSLAYDLGTKVPLYARHGIPEVWVIDAATRRTRVFRWPAGSGEASLPSASSYIEEASVEPGESLVCSGVVDDAGACVVVELARLLPPGA